MAKLLGGIFALVALAVCILNRIEPWTATVRGIVAFIAGHFAGALWESFFGQAGGKVIEADQLIEHSHAEADYTDGEIPSGEESAA